MKKIYTSLAVALTIATMNAQGVEYRILDEEFGTVLVDVNSSGKALHMGGYYDYATNTSTPSEDGEGTNKLNDDANVAGVMGLDVGGDTLEQAGFKKDGIWKAIGYFPGTSPQPGGNWFGGANAISKNSKYITGQISYSTSRSYPFLFDTSTNTLTRLTNGDDKWLYGRGEGVNDNGYVAGFVDREDFYDTGTFWVPAYFDAAGNVHYINLDPNNAQSGEAAEINNAGQVVGYQGDRPFLYSIGANKFESFNPPSGFENAVFTSISENGLVVGFAGFYPEREAIIYHPSLGNNPLILKDVLASKGITDFGTEDGKLGTAMGISDDGNWIVGFENVQGPPAFAHGWITNLNNELLSDNDCKINCPDNISTSVTSVSQTSVVVNYELPIQCQASPSQGLQVVLVEGKESGEAFPVGTTIVTHNLVDATGKVLYVCSFTVTVADAYCTMLPQADYNGITHVKFSGIDNVTTPYPTANGSYLDQIANVDQTKTYPFTIEANTWGTDNYVTVFIDWNQNGSLNDTGERYDLGIINSNGTDGVQLTGNIAVPADALVGKTRMRVVLNDGENVDGPCDNNNFIFGQYQDYSVDVKQFLGTNDLNSKAFQYYPNPVVDVLHLSSIKNIKNVALYSVDGKVIKTQAFKEAKADVDMRNLNAGVYVATVTFADGTTKTFKVIKK